MPILLSFLQMNVASSRIKYYIGRNDYMATGSCRATSSSLLVKAEMYISGLYAKEKTTGRDIMVTYRKGKEKIIPQSKGGLYRPRQYYEQ